MLESNMQYNAEGGGTQFSTAADCKQLKCELEFLIIGCTDEYGVAAGKAFIGRRRCYRFGELFCISLVAALAAFNCAVWFRVIA